MTSLSLNLALGSRAGGAGRSWVPTGAALYHDYQAGRYYGLPAPVDTHATNILVPNAAGVFDTFAPDVLVRNGKGVWTLPTRVNSFLNNIGNWSTHGQFDGTFATNVSLAPDGTMTGGRITAGTQAAGPFQNVSLSGSSLFVSGFVRKDSTATLCRIRLGGPSGAPSLYFNVSDGTVAANVGSWTNILVEDFGEWWRFGGMWTGDAAITQTIGFIPNSTPNTVVTGMTLGVWGIQVEVDVPFATPPIITGASAGVRNGNQPIIDVTGKLGNGGCFAILMKNPSLLQASTRHLVLSNGTGMGWIGLVGSASGVLRVAGNNGGANFGVNAPSPNSQTDTMAIVLGIDSSGIATGYWRTANGGLEASSPGGIASDQITMLGLGSLGFSNPVNSYMRTLKLAGFYDFTHYAEAKALADAWYAEAAA